MPGFLELFLSIKLDVCVCACVSAPESINYIHVIMNLYIKLSKFATFGKVTNQFYPWMWPY